MRRVIGLKYRELINSWRLRRRVNVLHPAHTVEVFTSEEGCPVRTPQRRVQNSYFHQEAFGRVGHIHLSVHP